MLNRNDLFKWIMILLPVIVAKAPDFININHEKKTVSNKNAVNKLTIDTANLTIHSVGLAQNYSIDIWSKSDECYQCSFYKVGSIHPKQKAQSIIVDTRWGTTINMTIDKINCNVSFHYFFGEHGYYSVNLSVSSETDKCTLTKISIDKTPYNSNLPILYGFLVLLGLGVAYSIGDFVYKKKFAFSAELLISNDLGDPSNVDKEQSSSSHSISNVSSQPRERLKSIDTFRGLCIVIMVFVNYKGGHYWFFRHSPWNGLTVADLVFPWFMFIMGVNITLSVDSLQRKNTPKREIAYKVVRRTLILFALGIFIINHNTNWASFRVPGVLQRFAISYFFAFVFQWAFHINPADLRTRATREDTPTWWYPIRDVVLYWPQWIIAVLFEALWLLLTFYLPVPGCPTGYIGAGGLANDGKYMNASCIGGAAGHIDRWMFGEDHIYGHPTAKTVYYPTTTDRVPYDPEGVLGSINSCLIVFFGSQMGKIFLYYDRPKSRITRWLTWGLLLGVISIILCKASANEGWIPVNKNLWTLTFITTLSSFAFLLMIIIYLVVDVYKLLSGSPFDFVGMNSILVYVGHETFQGYMPFSWGATEHSTHAEWLAMNMLGVFYWVLIAYYCFKIKFFVKI